VAEEKARTATLQLNNIERPTVLKVTLPKKITREELNILINEKIVNDIIARHTGCTCLSGTINILIESVYQDAIQVELGPARAA
jgi:hypothetical protein